MEETSKATNEENFPQSPSNNFINHDHQNVTSPAQVTHQTNDERKSRQECGDRRRQETTSGKEEPSQRRHQTRHNVNRGRGHNHTERLHSNARRETFHQRYSRSRQAHQENDNRNTCNAYKDNDNYNNVGRNRYRGRDRNWNSSMTERIYSAERSFDYRNHRGQSCRIDRDCSQEVRYRRHSNQPYERRFDDHDRYNVTPSCRFRDQRNHRDDDIWHRHQNEFYRDCNRRGQFPNERPRHHNEMNRNQSWNHRTDDIRNSRRHCPY